MIVPSLFNGELRHRTVVHSIIASWDFLQVVGVAGEGLMVVVKVLELAGQSKQLHDWQCQAFEIKRKFPA